MGLILYKVFDPDSVVHAQHGCIRGLLVAKLCNSITPLQPTTIISVATKAGLGWQVPYHSSWWGPNELPHTPQLPAVFNAS